MPIPAKRAPRTEAKILKIHDVVIVTGAWKTFGSMRPDWERNDLKLGRYIADIL
ncbi:hypothetical protein MASR2M17_18810 [Aminivibrio sp.]